MKVVPLSDFISALLKNNLISTHQLNEAKSRQSIIKKPLQELLVEMGYISEKDLIHFASKIFDIPVFSPEKDIVDISVTKLISDKMARNHVVFPVGKDDGSLILAISDPTNVIALDDINIAAKMPIKPVLCKKSDILKCIDKYYQLDDSLYDILSNIIITKVHGDEHSVLGEEIFDLKDNKHKSSAAVRLINFILKDAVKNKASDIHIEPQEKFVLVRYRLDGDLKNMIKMPRFLHAALVARIKILTKLDIAEKRKPQDGRVSILIDDRKIDLRISTMPTFYGEKIAIRLLDPKEARIELNKLGLHTEEYNTLVDVITASQGMILVTGPTGSGKTSTLYAALNHIKDETKNIITIEDPIEYLIESINQTQINPAKDITFANGLRNILRQDPNVILVGEIRDRDTANIALRASLTGHLVLSTLHTNSATSSITRLMDLGVDNFVISSALLAIVSQRLIKLICPHCKEEYRPSASLLNKFGSYIEKIEIGKFFMGRGCQQCNFTGYAGRTAVFEILTISEKIKTQIAQKVPESEIFKEAKINGLKPLIESAMEKVAKGLTTLDEIATCIYFVEDKKNDNNPVGRDINASRSSDMFSLEKNLFPHDHEGTTGDFGII